MNKVLQVLLVVIIGIIGTCATIWFFSTTAASIQEASSRGESFGVFITIALFVLIGLTIYGRIRRKSN